MQAVFLLNFSLFICEMPDYSSINDVIPLGEEENGKNIEPFFDMVQKMVLFFYQMRDRKFW